MKKIALACVGGWLIYSACTHHPSPSSSQSADSLSRSDTAEKTFFPVGELLESEILQVDSTPLAIQKFTIGNGRKDSALIKPAEFDALARQFLAPEFSNGRFEKEFTETSFIDNATQTATFTYSTSDKDLPLQRVDIVATPHGAAHQVKSIYLERNRVSGDSSILEKMFWNSGHRFQVISFISVKGQPPVERQLTVSWESGGENADNE